VQVRKRVTRSDLAALGTIMHAETGKQQRGEAHEPWNLFACICFLTRADETKLDSCHNPSCTAEPSDAKLLVCARCEVARFCNRACQAAHWKAHKPHCFPAPDSAPTRVYQRKTAVVHPHTIVRQLWHRLRPP
jgi:hypothetical protein